MPVSNAGLKSVKATPPPAIMQSALITRPWPVHQKPTGISRMVSHTRHKSEPTLSNNDFPLCQSLKGNSTTRYYDECPNHSFSPSLNMLVANAKLCRGQIITECAAVNQGRPNYVFIWKVDYSFSILTANHRTLNAINCCEKILWFCKRIPVSQFNMRYAMLHILNTVACDKKCTCKFHWFIRRDSEN